MVTQPGNADTDQALLHGSQGVQNNSSIVLKQ